MIPVVRTWTRRSTRSTRARGSLARTVCFHAGLALGGILIAAVLWLLTALAFGL